MNIKPRVHRTYKLVWVEDFETGESWYNRVNFPVHKVGRTVR
jgi:hypothetical protein